MHGYLEASMGLAIFTVIYFAIAYCFAKVVIGIFNVTFDFCVHVKEKHKRHE